MAQTNPKADNRVYIDFEPSYEWAQDEESDTLILMLKGFRKESLKVQIGTNRKLKLRGEQQMSENKWHRFNKEYTIPLHSNTNGIKAKLQGDLLYIRLPKSIITDEVKSSETKSTTPPNLKADDDENHNNKKPRGTNKDAPTHEEELPKLISEVSSNVSKEMHETNDDGFRKSDEKNKVDHQRLPPTTTLYGLVGELVKKKKLPNLLVVIFLFLGMGIYVKNAIKSSFGGSTIQDL